MSRVDVTFAKLHDDLFFGGKSFGKRLELTNNGGLRMLYDKEDKELIVSWNGKTAHIPSTNIVSYSTDPSEDRKIVQMASPQVLGIGSAQVETPMSHVHSGHGHGKTGQVAKK